MRELTQNECTMDNECKLNTAPICKAILSNTYYVRANPVNCKHGLYAACMTAPCVEKVDDKNQALCFCKVMNGSWVDFQWPYRNSNCQYTSGIITSTVPGGFDMRNMPGSEYVLEACKELPVN